MYDLNIIERGIRGIFGREFQTRARKNRYPQFCSVVDSDKKTEKYNAISTLPQMQKMTDERVIAAFSDYTYELSNEVYATGIRLPRTLFEFDQTGQLRTLISSLGSRVANFPDKLVYLTMAANGTGYDGVAHFASTHNLGDGVSQSNLDPAAGLTNAVIAAIVDKAKRDDAIAAIQMQFIAAKNALLSFNDDRGEPWHESADPESLIVFCHPKVEWLFRTALEASIISDTSNVLVKQVGQIISVNYPQPFWSDAGGTSTFYGTWYLMKIDTPIKPFIFQRFGPKTDFADTIPEADQEVLKALNSVEIQAVMRTGSNIDTHTFFDDEFLFGARAIYSAGYGMWQNIVKCTGALS
jgi:phage major head subunit gpT-like protein